MLPNQTIPPIVCNFAEPQRTPLMASINLVNEINELSRGQADLRAEIKNLTELCSTISKAVLELGEKLSQYDIDSGSEVSENNAILDENAEPLDENTDNNDDADSINGGS